MESTCFDDLTKVLTTAGIRRGVLGAAVGGLASLLGLAEAEARKKKGKGKKGKDKKKQQRKRKDEICRNTTGEGLCGDKCCNPLLRETCSGGRCCEGVDGVCCDTYGGWRVSCNGEACIPQGTTCCQDNGKYYTCGQGLQCGSEWCPGVPAP